MQWDFTFKGSKYELTLKPGNYLLECWGAQGGGKDVTALIDLGAGGKGGYSSGTIFLQKSTPIFVYVGGTGKVIANGFAEGGFNGGGSAWGTASKADPAGGGGGATDIRLNIDDLYSRVIVAGGGGGGGEDPSNTCGFGGGLEGGKNFYNSNSYPGTQTSSSNGATFGHGAHTPANGGGGGGGWYGGGVNYGQETPASSTNYEDTDGGSGGSGYVYTRETSNYYPTGCKLNPSYFLENAQTIGGNMTITEPNGASSIGHYGNGHARITFLGCDFKCVTGRRCPLYLYKYRESVYIYLFILLK